MIRYLLRRLAIGFATLIGITIVTFGIIQLAPGDPARMKLNLIQTKPVTEREYQLMRAHFGLDKPIAVQYGTWLKRLATFDLGNSFADGLPVRRKIGNALWPTISVSVVSIFLAFAISLPIGIFSAARQGGMFDKSVSTLLYILYSVPSYVVAIVLILYLGVKWDLLPIRGMRSDDFASLSPPSQALDYAKHYTMITICFTYGALAYYSRFTRQNLLEVIRQDYIRTARAKGLSEPVVILKHAFVNSLIPMITLLGMTIPDIISGSVILEYMFNWPGLGRLYIESVLQRDYPTLMALNFFTAFLVLLGTLLADLAYGLADPRVTYD